MRQDRASTLVSVLIVMAMIAIYVGAAYSFTLNLRRNVERSTQHRHAVAVADGALQFAFGHWRQHCRAVGDGVPTTAELAAIPLPTVELFPSLTDRVTEFTATRLPVASDFNAPTVSNYAVTALAANWAAAEAPVRTYGRTREDYSVHYRATVQVTLPVSSSRQQPLTAKLSQVFRKRSESPWDYAFFYTDYLDIHAGGPMTVRGPSHTMGTAYLGRASLTFTDQFSFGARLSMRPTGTGKHPTDPGAVDGSPPTFPSGKPPRQDTGKTPFGIEPFRFSTGDGNPDNDSYREIVERRAGPVTSDPFSENGRLLRLYDRADVRILVDNANVVTIRNRDDQVLSPTSTGTDFDIYEVFSAALTTNQNIRDNRESTTLDVRLISLDIGVLNSALRPAGGPNNGVWAGRLHGKGLNQLIYVSDISFDRAASRLRAIRLRNGASLPPGGLGIATDNPLYIQGDYNTGRIVGNEPPSNKVIGRDPLRSTVESYEWQPSVVFADAVSLLSNSWTDAASYNILSTRIPTNTTYNTSMVTGVRLIESAESAYSGGIENFPRFLEHWNNTFVVTTFGTMVQLFRSQQANRTWAHGSPRYTSPIREFNFDERFSTALPPGSFQLITYDRFAWSLNSF
jgi:hypothetical protein